MSIEVKVIRKSKSTVVVNVNRNSQTQLEKVRVNQRKSKSTSAVKVKVKSAHQGVILICFIFNKIFKIIFVTSFVIVLL